MAVHTNQPPHAREDSSVVHSALNIATKPVRSVLPHLLPFVACLLCIPVLLMMSGAAGWVVWRGIPVGWSADVYFQYGDSVNPYADVALSRILYDQPYDVSLHLVLPATESNYALGNFMTSLRLSDSYNNTITTARRPAVLVPSHPSMIREILTGTPSIVKIKVPLISGWIAGTTEVKAYIEVGRNDVWRGLGNGQTREVSVLQATLTGIVRPTGVRSILSRYPRLTTFLSSFVFFFFSIIVVTGFIFSAFGRFIPRDQARDSVSDEDAQSDGEEGNDEDGEDGEEDSDNAELDKKDEDVKQEIWEGRKLRGQQLHSDYHPEFTGIRKRISTISPSEESQEDHLTQTGHIKIEESVKLHYIPSTAYPKSPYPGPVVKEEEVIDSSPTDIRDEHELVAGPSKTSDVVIT